LPKKQILPEFRSPSVETILDKVYDSLTDTDILHLVHARLRAICASIGEPEALVSPLPNNPSSSVNHSHDDMGQEQEQQRSAAPSNDNSDSNSGTPQLTTPTLAEDEPYVAPGNDYNIGLSVLFIAPKVVSQI
jgi:hypothetical protein